MIRLDILERAGGVYADIDTIFHRAVPDELWEAESVIGEEAPVYYPDTPEAEPSLSNAFLMSRPGAWFITEWRRRIIGAMDGTWSGHSCRLATRLAREEPGRIRVEPSARFAPFGHTQDGIRSLLEEPLDPSALEGTSSVHLMAHLWWDRNRTDFSAFCALDATEAFIREGTTPLAHLVRPYLPRHGLF